MSADPRAWSTKYYDVSITSSDRSNFRPVSSKHGSGPDCEDPLGAAGFTSLSLHLARRQGPCPTTSDHQTTTKRHRYDLLVLCDSAAPVARAHGSGGGGVLCFIRAVVTCLRQPWFGFVTATLTPLGSLGTMPGPLRLAGRRALLL